MKKIGLISMILVLAMGIMGVGYAMWSETLVITETVNTGFVEVGIRNVGTDDNNLVGGQDPDEISNAGTNNVDPGWQGGGAFLYDKDVAHTESVNEGEVYFTKLIDEVETKFYHSVADTIYTAYPSYAPTMVFEITNNGSIPVRLHIGITWVEGANNPWDLDPFVDVVKWTATGTPSGSGTTFASMFSFLEGHQLEPCETLRMALTKHIYQEFDVDESGDINRYFEICPENASVTYTITVNAVQWNEYQ